MTPSGISKLPFAGYDVIVHLGVGILALPFVRNATIGWRGFDAPLGVLNFEDAPFAGALVLTLFVLFSGYVLGHVIAFASGYFIEKFVQMWLGYPSDMWLYICRARETSKVSIARGKMRKELRSTWRFGRVRPNLHRPHPVARTLLTLAHLPLWIPYAVIVLTGWFGFYFPKLPCAALPLLRKKFHEDGLPGSISFGGLWPKVLKQYIVSNCPPAYTRMSNHRVVFGLLRSLAFLALAYSWLQLWEFARLFGSDTDDALEHLGTSAVASIVAVMLVCGFAKFNRRFFEESVYAFVLTRSDDPGR